MKNARQRTVDYMNPTTKSPFPERIGVVAEDEKWEDVLELGDLVLTLGSKPLSRFIQRMDGFFSHTTLYIGDGHVAEAARKGVQAVPIEELRGSASMAMARPSLPKHVRDAAAAWADAQTARSRGGDAIDYGSADLGQAFAILLRAHFFPGRDDAPHITEQDMETILEAEERAIVERDGAEETSTCSGFAWRAYAECEGAMPIVPALLEGVLVGDDGRVRSTVSRVPEPRARMNPLWFKAFPAAAKLLADTDKGVLLSDAIGPGDLWCSPTVGRRRFLSPSYAEYAGFKVNGRYVER